MVDKHLNRNPEKKQSEASQRNERLNLFAKLEKKRQQHVKDTSTKVNELIFNHDLYDIPVDKVQKEIKILCNEPDYLEKDISIKDAQMAILKYYYAPGKETNPEWREGETMLDWGLDGLWRMRIENGAFESRLRVAQSYVKAIKSNYPLSTLKEIFDYANKELKESKSEKVKKQYSGNFLRKYRDFYKKSAEIAQKCINYHNNEIDIGVTVLYEHLSSLKPIQTELALKNLIGPVSSGSFEERILEQSKAEASTLDNAYCVTDNPEFNAKYAHVKAVMMPNMDVTNAWEPGGQWSKFVEEKYEDFKAILKNIVKNKDFPDKIEKFQEYLLNNKKNSAQDILYSFVYFVGNEAKNFSKIWQEYKVPKEMSDLAANHIPDHALPLLEDIRECAAQAIGTLDKEKENSSPDRKLWEKLDLSCNNIVDNIVNNKYKFMNDLKTIKYVVDVKKDDENCRDLRYYYRRLEDAIRGELREQPPIITLDSDANMPESNLTDIDQLESDSKPTKKYKRIQQLKRIRNDRSQSDQELSEPETKNKPFRRNYIRDTYLPESKHSEPSEPEERSMHLHQQNLTRDTYRSESDLSEPEINNLPPKLRKDSLWDKDNDKIYATSPEPMAEYISYEPISSDPGEHQLLNLRESSTNKAHEIHVLASNAREAFESLTLKAQKQAVTKILKEGTYDLDIERFLNTLISSTQVRRLSETRKTPSSDEISAIEKELSSGSSTDKKSDILDYKTQTNTALEKRITKMYSQLWDGAEKLALKSSQMQEVFEKLKNPA